ncbi:MAG: RICIN domain-containing protein [Pseudomonadota bacterium]
MSICNLLKRSRLTVTLVATGLSLIATSAYAVTGKFVPATGVLMTVGQDVDSINAYVSSMGFTPAGVTNYVGITTLDGLNANGDAGAGRNNVREIATTYPNSVLVVGISMNGQVDAVASGSYNNNIETLLTTLASYNRPVFLRWAYEVDGPWNNHSPSGVIQSFRYVHGRIAALGYANRIAMVWQTMSYCPINSDINAWYPGDQYVDWVGLSYFSPQDCAMREVNKTADFAKAHNKPLMINESTPQRYAIGELTYSADGAAGTGRVNKTAAQIWSEWYVNYFGFMKKYAANLKAVTYINANWNAQPRWASGNEGYWGDSRVQANATLKANWLNELNTNALTGTPFLYKTSGGLFGQLGYGSPVNASLPSGFHQIINKNNNKCVDIAGVSTANGAAATMWDCISTAQNQQWQFVATDSGFYRLMVRHSNKALNVNGVSAANGALFSQWDWVGGHNQQWKAVDVGGGYYKFIGRQSGRAMDVPGCSTANGTQLNQWDDFNNACQAFRLIAR